MNKQHLKEKNFTVFLNITLVSNNFKVFIFMFLKVRR